MTEIAVKVYHSPFPQENISMSNDIVLALLFVIGVGGGLLYWLAFQSGRMIGYRHGLEKGTKLNGQTQHLKGMNDGYVMALQHTPGQRHEFMNNVLIKTGAMSREELEAERRLRFRLKTEQ
ncbi:hypothetical protein [Noviherbaspirillum aerium]|uniref:hypothetical protein n=1 Tax=Noviherbaspirillum aerium TaxID=2588497 RepID=UPI00124CD7DC|nr:hypothetical protein [Noviherbaspirillum aerium]